LSTQTDILSTQTDTMFALIYKILLHCFVRFVGAALVMLLWYPVESANVVLIILLLLTCRLFWGCYVYALMIFLENLLVLFWLFSCYWFVDCVCAAMLMFLCYSCKICWCCFDYSPITVL
jgi:hypothetical protein